MTKPKVFYICNRKRCETCHPECTHTSDIKYAKNFDKVPTTAEFFKRFSFVQTVKNAAYFEKDIEEVKYGLEKM